MNPSNVIAGIIILAYSIIFPVLADEHTNSRLSTVDKPMLQDKQTHRFTMGVYYPSIVNLITRADFQVAINFWLDEFGPQLGLKSTQASLFDDIRIMQHAFDSGELDFIMAPPILLAKYIDRTKLADGFVGTSIDGSDYGTVLLVRKDQHINSVKQLGNKRLLLPTNDDLAVMFLDTLIIKNFQRHYQQVFSRVMHKDRQSAVVLDVFFKQADVGMTYKEIYHLMVEMNPQINEDLQILASFPTRSPNYGYFHHSFPADLRHKITQRVLELNQEVRSQQILNDLRMTSLIPCSVDELKVFDELILEYQSLQQEIKK